MNTDNKKYIMTKGFNTKSERDEFLIAKFGSTTPTPEKGLADYDADEYYRENPVYNFYLHSEKDIAFDGSKIQDPKPIVNAYIVFYINNVKNHNDKITLYKELFENMVPNQYRGNMACFEGTAKHIADNLHEDPSEVLRVLKHFRNDRSSTLVSYSGDGNIKPRTTNSSTLYWRINLGTIQVVKHKDEKPPKKSPKKKSKKKENKGNKEKPGKKKKKRKFDFS